MFNLYFIHLMSITFVTHNAAVIDNDVKCVILDFTFTYLGNCGQELGTPLDRNPHRPHTWQGRLGRGSADTGCRAAGGSWEETLLPGHFGTPQPDLPLAPGLDRPALQAYQGRPTCRCQADLGVHGPALFSDRQPLLLPFVLQLLLLLLR